MRTSLLLVQLTHFSVYICPAGTHRRLPDLGVPVKDPGPGCLVYPPKHSVHPAEQVTGEFMILKYVMMNFWCKGTLDITLQLPLSYHL